MAAVHMLILLTLTLAVANARPVLAADAPSAREATSTTTTRADHRPIELSVRAKGSKSGKRGNARIVMNCCVSGTNFLRGQVTQAARSPSFKIRSDF